MIEDADWVGTFLDELSEFPNGDHDDQVDSFTQLLMYCRNHHYLDYDKDYADDLIGAVG